MCLSPSTVEQAYAELKAAEAKLEAAFVRMRDAGNLADALDVEKRLSQCRDALWEIGLLRIPLAA